MKLVNKKKAHFSDKVDTSTYFFNQEMGSLIAQEFKEANNMPSYDTVDEVSVMKYCCQLSAVFQEFNKILLGGYSHGALLLTFIEEGGIEAVKNLIVW